MNSSSRKIAPAAIRLKIIECLKNNDYRIYSDGQRYLDQQGLRPAHIVEDLIEELGLYELFEFPKKKASDPQKYDYVIPYEDPELLIYVKIAPRDTSPPLIFLTFHHHNIPGSPLPRTLISQP